jgi:excisionase family DNA binding protein
MEANVNSLDNYGRPRRREPMQFLTIREVAERLNVATRTVRRWIDLGLLPVHRFGRTVRISGSDLAAFLATHRAA